MNARSTSGPSRRAKSSRGRKAKSSGGGGGKKGGCVLILIYVGLTLSTFGAAAYGWVR